MGTRTITLHAFCSAKGGVGKSTLAVACAKLLVRGGAVCVLIDADLTGTSLADGLDLCAPRVPLREDGTLDLDAPPVESFYSRAETRALRDKRMWRGSPERPSPPVFFNDALRYKNEADPMQECRIDALLWHAERDDGIRYLPSSPLRADVEYALGWLFVQPRKLAWLRRFAWLLDELSIRLPELTDVVIDLPPGVFGFAHEALQMMSSLSQGLPLPDGAPEWTRGDVLWKVRPFLVMSQDRNDLVVAMDFFAESYPALPELMPVVNRVTEGFESIRSRVRERFEARGTISTTGPEAALAAAMGSVLPVDQLLRSIDDVREVLGQTFLDGDLPIDELTQDQKRALEDVLLPEARR